MQNSGDASDDEDGDDGDDDASGVEGEGEGLAGEFDVDDAGTDVEERDGSK